MVLAIAGSPRCRWRSLSIIGGVEKNVPDKDTLSGIAPTTAGLLVAGVRVAAAVIF
jgi:hypothetical protein